MLARGKLFSSNNDSFSQQVRCFHQQAFPGQVRLGMANINVLVKKEDGQGQICLSLVNTITYRAVDYLGIKKLFMESIFQSGDSSGVIYGLVTFARSDICVNDISMLDESCPKVRLSHDRLPIEPFACVFLFLSLSLRSTSCKCRLRKCCFAQMSLNRHLC